MNSSRVDSGILWRVHGKKLRLVRSEKMLQMIKSGSICNLGGVFRKVEIFC